jgi:hypothetical protein
LSIDRAIASLTEERRADYLFPTKTAADAVGCHPNKFGDWLYRSRDKWVALARACPAEVGAEFAAILARAIDERERVGGHERHKRR